MIGYWHQFESLTIIDDFVYRQIFDTNSSVQIFQLFVPKIEVSKILKMLHNYIAAGDLGITNTLHCIWKRFYLLGVKGDVEAWVSSCDQCQKWKGAKQKHCLPILKWPASQPFYHISCDILDLLPISKGHKYIFMIGDKFFRWFEAIPLQDIKANTVRDALIDAWITRIGVPEYIHSDNGVQFTSKPYEDVCYKLGMEPTYSTLYHPQGNAKVLRINRTLEDWLAK